MNASLNLFQLTLSHFIRLFLFGNLPSSSGSKHIFLCLSEVFYDFILLLIKKAQLSPN